MLFASIVFMSRTLRGQWIHVVLVFIIKLNIASSAQIPHENVMTFSGDFEGFLKDLGSMVYKTKRTARNDLNTNDDRHTTVAYKNNRRSQNIYNTQKAALADVLMMKLVSYYEDKYKLTHVDSTTTESITLVTLPPTTVNKMSYSVEPVQRIDMVDNKLQNQVDDGKSRRMETENTMRKMVEDDSIPEVVIL